MAGGASPVPAAPVPDRLAGGFGVPPGPRRPVHRTFTRPKRDCTGAGGLATDPPVALELPVEGGRGDPGRPGTSRRVSSRAGEPGSGTGCERRGGGRGPSPGAERSSVRAVMAGRRAESSLATRASPETGRGGPLGWRTRRASRRCRGRGALAADVAVALEFSVGRGRADLESRRRARHGVFQLAHVPRPHVAESWPAAPRARGASSDKVLQFDGSAPARTGCPGSSTWNCSTRGAAR